MEKVDFIGHKVFSLDNIPTQVDNILVQSTEENNKWIEKTTNKIAEWRGLFQSTYIRWALIINGLDVSNKKYSSEVKDGKTFTIQTLRTRGMENIVEWDKNTTAKNCLSSIPMVASWGVLDLYSCLEEFIFDIYRIYLKSNPSSIMQGKDFQYLRRLHREFEKNQTVEISEKWEEAIEERLNAWQRKKLYEGLDKILLSYMNATSLKKPSIYTLSTPETWAETIKGIAELRNSFTHGAKTVSKELADFSKLPHSMLFDFKENEELQIELIHLQSVECFCNQLLSALNLSLVEKFWEITHE